MSTGSIRSVEALTASLLLCASRDPDGFAYRQMGPNSFTKEPVGYTSFKSAYDGFVAAGLIDCIPGKRGSGGPGTATRMKASAKLIDTAKAHGIELANVRDHFAFHNTGNEREPVVIRSKAVRKGRKRHQGKKLVLNTSHPAIMNDIERINPLNVFIAGFTIEGFANLSVQRVYCDSGNDDEYGRYGGRLYSEFQSLERKKRWVMRLQGESTLEVDISGSFLTIYHSLVGKPLDTSHDPYQMAWPPREVAKAYVNAALGYGKWHKRWPSEVVKELKEKHGIDAKHFPTDQVRQAIVTHFPTLSNLEESGITWGHLHYAEGSVILSTMETLAFEHGILTLPVHDALMVPSSKVQIAKRVLTEEFERQIGVRPIIKFKESSETLPIAA